MYHQIARNKRNSVFVVIGFLVVWIVVGSLSSRILSRRRLTKTAATFVRSA
jgi:hypothetical protein